MSGSRMRPPTSKVTVPLPSLFLVSLSLIVWLVVGVHVDVSPAQVVLDGTTGGRAGQALGAGTLPNGQMLSDGSRVTDHLIPHDVGKLMEIEKDGKGGFRKSLAGLTAGLSPARKRQVVAVFLAIYSAPFWELLRKRGGLSGADAIAAAEWAMTTLLEGLRRDHPGDTRNKQGEQ